MDFITNLIDFFNNLFQPLVDFFTAFQQHIIDWFYKDIYPWVTKTIAEWIKASLISSIQFKIMALSFCWDIAKDLLDSLHVSQHINSAWSMLDSRIMQLLTFFRIPEGINLLISALTTRFVYRFLGF